MGRGEHGLGEGFERIEPVAPDAAVDLAPLGADEGEPVYEIRLGLAGDAGEEALPGTDEVQAELEALGGGGQARDARLVEPFGLFLGEGREAHLQLDHRAGEAGEAGGSGVDRLREARGEGRDFGFQAVAALLVGGAGEDVGAHGGDQGFDGAVGLASRDAAEPVGGGEFAREVEDFFQRGAAFAIVAGDVEQAGGKAAAAAGAAAWAVGAEQPAAQFDCLAAGEGDGEGAVGGGVEVVAFVEDDAGEALAFAAGADGVRHHQRMVGDDEARLLALAHRLLDEAAAEVRAGRADAFAAPVCQCRQRRAAAEQAGEPAGEVAADHVAVRGEARPAGDQLGEDGRAAGEGALHRVLEVEKAEIILAALADNHLARRDEAGQAAAGLGLQLALQGAGVGGEPDLLAGFGSVEACRREIAERLADAGAGFGNGEVGALAPFAGLEGVEGGSRVAFLALARLAPVAGEALEGFERVRLGVGAHQGRQAGRGVRPFGKRDEDVGGGRCGAHRFADGMGPEPATAMQAFEAFARAGAMGPLAVCQPGQEGRCGPLQEGGFVLVAHGRFEA